MNGGWTGTVGPLEGAVRGAVLSGARGVRGPRRDEPSPNLEGVVGLAERFGTPFYLYDFDLLEARALSLRSILPSRFENTKAS